MVQELNGEKYFTIQEAAAMLRRHPKTVWRWTLEGKITFHQPSVGCKILIPEQALKQRL
jgi:excisionase family DNA binding protein